MRTSPKRYKGRRLRKTATRTLRKRFLIVCEGEKTEPNYFRAFRVNIEVRIAGEGKNTITLVKAAQGLNDKEGPFDSVWVVYDKDNFSSDQFNTASKMALDSGFHIAWSNQCFELWYLLHFQYSDSALHRTQLIERLNDQLPSPYCKNDTLLYDKLLSLQPQAIQNAKRLEDFHGEHTLPASADPCTHVHNLVAELNDHLIL
jgi:hypothetical protein